jgi:DNA uptake protein ComE-like DNA-binding protein
MAEVRSFDRITLGRRGLLVATFGAGLALALPRSLVFAQETDTSEGALVAPDGAAAWPLFNLDVASAEQFMGIPGVGERMVREFEEYRPYTSIGQFRAEIGKYIAPEEVAALEAYLFVPVDPNQADAETLRQLPGVSDETAQTLIAGRPYASADEFLTALAEHAEPELVTAAKTYLAPDAGPVATWLKYNLNTATTAQFMGIPGAGDRMVREFEEYRPYSSIGQFRAELGKYIAPEEVAAFERYLFVPVAPSEADAEALQQLPGVNADVAGTLAAEGPFDSPEALLAALETAISPDLVAAAKAYVAGA